ncbi:MAG: HAD-IA family hydrolase [Mycoplasmataceae bacterium]|nr:HAD-IA family hydrolase [Mycoplasmataceae bacterium]
MIKAVLFDVGGTLFDSKSKDKKKHAAKEFLNYLILHGINLKITPDEFIKLYKKGSKAFKSHSTQNGNFDVQPYDLFVKWVFADKKLTEQQLKTLKIIANNALNIYKINAGGSLKKNLQASLKRLRLMKIKMGIISNTDSLNYVTLRLIKSGIYKYFEPNCIYLSAVSQTRKPDPDIFLEACRDLHALPSETVYIGDTISRDVVGSRNANFLASIRVDNERIKSSDVKLKIQEEIDTKYVIRSVSQIPAMIKQIELENGKKPRKFLTIKKTK